MSSLRNEYQKVTQRAAEIDFRISMAMGRQSGFKPALVIGNTEGQDISDGQKTIWDQDTTLVRLTSDTEIFVSSTNAADVGISVAVTVINEESEVLSSIIQLDGQNQVTTGSSGILVQIATVIGPTTPQGDLFFAPSTALTGGKPDDVTLIQSKIIQGLNATHNGFIIIPKGFSGIAMNSRATTQSPNKIATIRNYATPVGGIPLVTAEYSVSVNPLEFMFLPPIGINEFLGTFKPAFPEGTYIETVASVDSNDTNIFFGIDFILARDDKFAII